MSTLRPPLITKGENTRGPHWHEVRGIRDFVHIAEGALPDHIRDRGRRFEKKKTPRLIFSQGETLKLAVYTGLKGNMNLVNFSRYGFYSAHILGDRG